jgi:dTDP-4-amino-4,6-dideoxy-D-galactose acyltransferase
MMMQTIKFLDWDSAFFGVNIARVVPNCATPEELAAVVDEADRSSIAALYWLVGCDDPLSPRAAEACGFHLVDIRITFEKEVSSRTGTDNVDPPRVRPLVEEDLPALLALARRSHRDSRFFFDGNFGEEQCAMMYEEWILASLRTDSDTILVTGAHGLPTGYCVCHRSDDQTGSIGLIAVDPQARQNGVGTALVSAAIDHFVGAGMRRATVVTQGRNIASQRLYQRSGFLTKSVQLWYHRWSTAGKVSFP